MSRIESSAGPEENGLFTKNGVPVKFCFHPSVRQGRAQISEDIERFGGQVVENERETNVLLVDEEENITLIRRRYYSSSELYRMSIFIEPRGFVRHCINDRYYGHLGPPRQGMPGPAPKANLGRVRTPFTSEDKQYLARYLATIFPTREGRLGMKAYKELVELGQGFDDYAWARRHTAHSWREHYKKNQEELDRWIAFYYEELEPHGHHLGEDRRTRNRGVVREEDDESDEAEQQHHRGERVEQGAEPPQARADAVARNYLARHEPDLIPFEEEVVVEEEEEEDVVVPEKEVANQEPQRIKRHHPEARRQHDSQESNVKRARVATASSKQKDQAPAIEQRRGGNQVRGEDAVMEESPDVAGSDLFGDREYEEGPAYDYENTPDLDLPRPPSPEGTSVVDGDGPPPLTQATLVASPVAEKHASPRNRVAQTPAPRYTAPPSSQATLVMTEERVAVRRVRGASTQAGAAASSEAPYRNTRARSRSAEPLLSGPVRHEAKDKGKAKGNGLLPIAEVEQVEDDTQPAEKATEGTSSAPLTTDNGLSTRETFEDEIAVEDLLGTDSLKLESDDDDDEEYSPLPRFQEIDVDDVENGPSDSDDAETHQVLEFAAQEGSPRDDEDEGSESEHEEEDDENRINNMANRSLTQPAAHSGPTSQSAPPSRVTRSMARLAPQRGGRFSPRKTRSNSQIRNQEPQFPSPGTKARVVVDRVNEAARNLPYAPPAGSRAARALRRAG